MNVRSLLIVAAAVLVSSSALAANPLSAKAESDSGVFVAATLCTAGSFECQVAPSYTKLAVTRRNAAVALRKGAITVVQAQAVQDQADLVRSLLDKSLAACGQNDRTGKCTKNAAEASRLLAQAKAGLARLK